MEGQRNHGLLEKICEYPVPSLPSRLMPDLSEQCAHEGISLITV